ncbi:hypothetical protein [Bradyrhizobium lablabi]|uniref:hypothetical protein n=1 Tax=Bradyrhizobium lablabi TaxID=722472 RepID=UPI000A441F04|nr:hypothetical protein [Bradyrhizobium lablabi]
MSKVIEARAIVSATDSTGNTLDKIASKFKHLEKTAKAVESIKPLKFTGNLMDELKRLGLAEKDLQKVRREMHLFDAQLKSGGPVRASAYFRAMDDWKSKTVAHWRAVKIEADAATAAQARFASASAKIMPVVRSAAGWLGGGYAGYRGARYIFDKSREGSSETERQRQVGLTQAQSDEIAAEAEKQSKAFPSVSQTELRAATREAVMQLGDQRAGIQAAQAVAEFMTVGKPMWGEQTAEQVRKALQGADARGITTPDRIRSWLDAQARASQVEGGADFTAQDMRTAIRFGRSALKGQSDRFMASVLPGLAVDMGPGQAGTGIQSLYSGLIGGTQKKAALEFQRKHGLREKDGRLVGQEAFTHDLDKWVDETLIPRMQKAGVNLDDTAAVGEFATKAISNRTGADVITNLVSQREMRWRKAQQYALAKGLEGAGQQHQRDVGTALEGVSKQLTNLATSADTAKASIGALNSIMTAIQKLGDSGAGVALGQGIRNNVEDITRMFEDFSAMAERINSAFERAKKALMDPLGLLPKGENQSTRMGGPRNQSSTWPTSASAVPYTGEPGENSTYVPATGYRTSGAARLGGGRFIAAPTFPAPEVTATMTHGTTAGGGAISVNGTVSGEAHLDQTIKIEASPYFEAKMNEIKGMVISLRGQMNGPGSNGKSSPDAAAPSHPSGGHH